MGVLINLLSNHTHTHNHKGDVIVYGHSMEHYNTSLQQDEKLNYFKSTETGC